MKHIVQHHYCCTRHFFSLTKVARWSVRYQLVSLVLADLSSTSWSLQYQLVSSVLAVASLSLSLTHLGQINFSSKPTPHQFFGNLLIFGYLSIYNKRTAHLTLSMTLFPTLVMSPVGPELHVKNQSSNAIRSHWTECTNIRWIVLEDVINYLYETSTFTPFVKPHAILNLAVCIVFYVQSA